MRCRIIWSHYWTAPYLQSSSVQPGNVSMMVDLGVKGHRTQKCGRFDISIMDDCWIVELCGAQRNHPMWQALCFFTLLHYSLVRAVVHNGQAPIALKTAFLVEIIGMKCQKQLSDSMMHCLISRWDTDPDTLALTLLGKSWGVKDEAVAGLIPKMHHPISPGPHYPWHGHTCNTGANCLHARCI